MNTDILEIRLIKAFKKGDTEAFKLLFEKYHKRLYFFLFGLLRSKEDTEEIVQETFLKIWESRKDFRENYPFGSLLFRIARNTSLNYLRKKVNRAVFEDRFSLLSDLSENTADQYVIFKETQSAVDSVLNGLPPKRKEIFLLQKMDGLSREEIAAKLKISVVTVDHQLAKANKYVRDRICRFCFQLIQILVP